MLVTEKRPAIEKGLIAGVVVLIVAVAGVGYYLSSQALAPAPPAQTTTASSAASSSQASSSAAGSTTSQSGGLSNATTSSVITSSASTSNCGITITNMFGRVVAPGDQAAASNTTSYDDRQTYCGPVGQNFQVEFDVVYQLCGQCPQQLTAVVLAQTPGFNLIVPTSPPMPVDCIGQTGVNVECTFTVTVQPPSTPYTGTLTLVAQG